MIFLVLIAAEATSTELVLFHSNFLESSLILCCALPIKLKFISAVRAHSLIILPFSIVISFSSKFYLCFWTDTQALTKVGGFAALLVLCWLPFDPFSSLKGWFSSILTSSTSPFSGNRWSAVYLDPCRRLSFSALRCYLSTVFID
jgi:hypothetical protein